MEQFLLGKEIHVHVGKFNYMYTCLHVSLSLFCYVRGICLHLLHMNRLCHTGFHHSYILSTIDDCNTRGLE